MTPGPKSRAGGNVLSGTLLIKKKKKKRKLKIAPMLCSIGHFNAGPTSCDEFGNTNLSGLAAGTSCSQFGPNFPSVPFWYFRYSGNFGFQIRPQLGTDLRKVPRDNFFKLE